MNNQYTDEHEALTFGGIGDVFSQEKGSGARYNAGKPPLELLPIRVIVDDWRINDEWRFGDERKPALLALQHLADFQEGSSAADLYAILGDLGITWAECAQVFDYGRRKYAAWNWAKGMKWSVPIGCMARHILFGLMAGEELDPESGLPHKGHIGCNVVMLLTFMRNYKEGDDRPVKELSCGTR